MALPLGEINTKSLKTKGGRREMISQEERAKSRIFLVSLILKSLTANKRIERIRATIKLVIRFVIKGGKWICLINEKNHLLGKRRIMANDKRQMYLKVPFNFPLKPAFAFEIIIIHRARRDNNHCPHNWICPRPVHLGHIFEIHSIDTDDESEGHKYRAYNGVDFHNFVEANAHA